jgi:murein DD-endopeptidase MepM/ murein hydrolase activator NlpD
VLWSGTSRPTAVLRTPLETIGKATTVDLSLHAGRAGLRSWRLALVGENGTYVLAEGDVERRGSLGSGERDLDVSVTVDAGKSGIPEGPARLEAFARDYSPADLFRREAAVLTQPVTVDVTPPRVTVLGGQHYLTLGGNELVLYTTDADAVRSGVQVGSYFFPGDAGMFADGNAYAAFFAVPQELDTRVIAKVVATDRAGNSREVPFPCSIRDKRFPAAEITISDDFLFRKIPEFASLVDLSGAATPVDQYLVVNRELRKTSEARIHEITQHSAPRPLFDGAFRQQPNTKVVSRFAEHRTYRYKGDVIDHQTHLGYDLASVKQTPIEAANSGTVLFAGNLGIYGNAVIIDHGLGIASLYAHLSSIDVKEGQTVAKGEGIGRSGETGLAGGDHLHFSIMLRGVHIDPVEWWDPKWVREHVATELASLPAASHDATATAAGVAPVAAAVAEPAPQPTAR